MKNAQHPVLAELSALNRYKITKTCTEHQQDMFAFNEFNAFLPQPRTKAYLAHQDLLSGNDTQIDWLQWGCGGRLAAAVKELFYDNTPLISVSIKTQKHPASVSAYSLRDYTKQYTLNRLKGADCVDLHPKLTH